MLQGYMPLVLEDSRVYSYSDSETRSISFAHFPAPSVFCFWL